MVKSLSSQVLEVTSPKKVGMVIGRAGFLGSNLAAALWVAITDLPAVTAGLLEDFLTPRDSSTRSAATASPLASAIAFCSVRALARKMRSPFRHARFPQSLALACLMILQSLGQRLRHLRQKATNPEDWRVSTFPYNETRESFVYFRNSVRIESCCHGAWNRELRSGAFSY